MENRIEAKEAPGPKGNFLLGSLLDLQRQGMIAFYVANWKKYGDTVRFKMGPMNSFLFAHPDDIRYILIGNKGNFDKGISMDKIRLSLGNGLFAAEGDLWRRQRRLMGPLFTPRAVSAFYDAMLEDIQGLVTRWASQYSDGAPFDVSAEMMRLAMGIIARTMFSINVNDQAWEAGNAFTYVLEYASEATVRLIDWPQFIPTAANRKFRDSMQILDDFIYGVIEARAAIPDDEQPDDLLGLLLTTVDEETGERMTIGQIRDEVVTIFFAGHETTAQALTWTWYLLAQHPEAEMRMYEEVVDVLDGRIPALADMENLTYTRQVIDEAMRIYPPIWVYARQAIADDVIGGYHVPAGSLITLSQFITHRHPEFWENPEAFNPDNFAPGKMAKRPKYAYFPFGGGQRICIGNNFALLEAVLALAVITQHYRLHLVPEQSIKPKMVGTLRPDQPVMMTLERRSLDSGR